MAQLLLGTIIRFPEKSLGPSLLQSPFYLEGEVAPVSVCPLLPKTCLRGLPFVGHGLQGQCLAAGHWGGGWGFATPKMPDSFSLRIIDYWDSGNISQTPPGWRPKGIFFGQLTTL